MNDSELIMTKLATKHLKGKTIKKVYYLEKNDAEQCLWHQRPIVIEFEDGSIIMPMSDDEGNDGGSLHFYEGNGGESDTIGVLWND